VKKIGFIGIGNIANAIINGALKGGILGAENLCLYDIDQNKLSSFAEKGAVIAKSIKDLAQNTDLLFLTVKPQILMSVLEELKPNLKQDTLIISPVAGVKMAKINQALGGNKKIIRVMPNTPLMYSVGATAIAVGQGVSDEERDFCEKIFASSGVTAILPEEQIDAVTGISGSSPAFFMRFAREIIKEGVLQDVSPEVAEKLVLGTMFGTAKMAMESPLSLNELIKAVASPGGTTEAGLKTMDELDFDKLVSKTISAAVERSKELSK
jgi:pyrroline-5-carboxylate reductase